MKTNKLGLFVLLASVCLGIIVFFTLIKDGRFTSGSRSPDTNPPIQSTAATSAKGRNATEVAFTHINQFAPEISGSTEVLLTQTISFSDFSKFGLGKFNPSPDGINHRLELVLLKGRFDTSNFGIGQKASFKEASYVVVVYDYDAQAVANMTVSVNGDEFKSLLNLVAVTPEK